MKKTVVAVLMVLALVGGGWWFMQSHQTKVPQTQATPSAPNQPPASSDKSEVSGLEVSLNSGDGQTQLSALAPSMRDAYESAGQKQFLPDGTKLVIQEGTMQINGDFANVEATMNTPGKPTANMVLLLTREDTTKPWKLIDFKQK